MDNLILDLPFDEADGSTVAYDYSPSGVHADVINGRFLKGREGNCVSFPAAGYVEILTPIIDFESTYTVFFWITATPTIYGPTNTWILINFPGFPEFRIDLHTKADTWTMIALSHKEGTYAAYVDARPVEVKSRPVEWGVPTGFSIENDNGYNEPGWCSIDLFRVVDGKALTTNDLIPVVSTFANQIRFVLNGIDFKSLGININSIKGLTDKLEQKVSEEYNWPDEHGVFEDLDDIRYEPREIELGCWFSSIGKDAMLNTMSAIKDQVQRNGTQRLHVDIGTKPLVYEVHHKGKIEFENKWREGKAFCEFTLNFRENQPVKRVLRYIKVDDSTPDLEITLTSYKMLDIYWGDGTNSRDVHGTNLPITRKYTSPGTYYIIIAGVIEKIESFTHNAVMVWSKLQ